MSTAIPFAAIILCGGESRRMGQAKALLPWQGRTLLEHIVATLAPLASPVVVVAAPEQELPTLPADVLIMRDAVAGEGPLRGLEAGLSALTGRADLAFVCGCDMPELSPDLISYLAQFLGDHESLVVEHDGYWQPLHAFYRVDLLPQLQTALAAGERSPQHWLRTVNLLVVPADSLREINSGLRSLRNVNTPQEFQERFLWKTFDAET